MDTINNNQPKGDNILTPATEERPKDIIKILGTWGCPEKADSMSKRLRLSDEGDLYTWVLHRDDRIRQCQMHNRPMNPAGYIVNGLNGFFADHGC